MAAESIERITRVCTRCREEKPATSEFFPPHKMGRYGLHPFCFQCKKADDTARRHRPDQKARQKAWRDANKDYIRRYNERYRTSGYNSTEDVRRWREQNIDKAREKERERQKRYRRTNPAKRLKERLSARLYTMLKDKNGRATEDLLGFTRQELKAHIERQFLKGMGWNNIGKWHVDHILPVSMFNITSVDDPDFKVCWALSNLRPMWSGKNISKGGKRLHLI